MYGGASQFGGEGWVTTQAGAPGGSAQKVRRGPRAWLAGAAIAAAAAGSTTLA